VRAISDIDEVPRLGSDFIFADFAKRNSCGLLDMVDELACGVLLAVIRIDSSTTRVRADFPKVISNPLPQAELRWPKKPANKPTVKTMNDAMLHLYAILHSSNSMLFDMELASSG
jgi:hypothetical protein